MEKISAIRKFALFFYFFTITFIIVYSASIWITVFTISGPYEYDGESINLNIGIHSGSPEAALNITLPIIFLLLIPLIWSLIYYWKGESKTKIIKTALLGAFVFHVSGIIVSLLFAFSVRFGILIVPYIFIATGSAISSYIVLFFLFLVIDKKYVIFFLPLIIGIILLGGSFLLPPQIHMVSGCNNYRDYFCSAKLAVSKKDVSICNNVVDETADQWKKEDCVFEYAFSTRDFNVCELLTKEEPYPGRRSPWERCLSIKTQ